MKMFGRGAGNWPLPLIGVFCAVLAVFCGLLTGCEEAPVSEETMVTFSSVTAGAANGTSTAYLTLYFDKRVETKDNPLAKSDITLTGVPGVSLGALNGPDPAGTGFSYILGISGFTTSGKLTVTVAKAGFAFSPSSRDVDIVYLTPVTFKSVRANGSLSMTTTKLSLVFDKQITGLSADDITLEFPPSANISKVPPLSEPIIEADSVTYYLDIRGTFRTGQAVTVKVEKKDYRITGSPQEAEIFFYDTPIDFISVVADGSLTQNTTKLFLSFSQPITGLQTSDIILSNISGIRTGTLSGPTSSVSPFTYTLTIDGFAEEGQLSVSVAKTGFNIVGSPKQVRIYYTTPVTFIDVSANLVGGESTTELTLVFSQPIAGLSETDITITPTDSSLIVYKGKLEDHGNQYTLPINGFSKGGQLRVAVLKAGYSISPPSWTVEIYYASPTFESIAAFSSWLTKMSSNHTPTITPYSVKLNKQLSDTSPPLTIKDVLTVNRNKYVSIELTGSINKIDANEFEGCNTLTSISLGAVTTIGNEAFKDCKYLSVVTLGNGTSSVPPSAFTGCSSLTAINVPRDVDGNNLNSNFNSVNGVLYNNNSRNEKDTLCIYPAGKTGPFVIPDDITTIGDSAFEGCTGLQAINLNNVTSIGASAFAGCSGLNMPLTIPGTVASIGASAFAGCKGLTTVTIPISTSNLSGLSNAIFKDCTSLTSITIPFTVTSIGDSAFANTGFTSVTIPIDVISIGDEAYKGCTNLASVTISDSVTSVGKEAFANCTRLNSVTIYVDTENDKTLKLGEGVFKGSGLTSIELPVGVEKIEKNAFENCTALIRVTLGGNTTSKISSIGDYAFRGCNKLTSISIPLSVESLGEEAFAGCIALTTVSFPADTGGSPRNTTIIGKAAFKNCSNLATNTANPLLIPDSVTYIGDEAYSGCINITSVIIPNQVDDYNFGQNVFSGCTKVTTINTGNGLSALSADTFKGCDNLEGITIGESITTIDERTFTGFNKLATITVHEDNGTFAATNNVLYNNAKTSLLAYPRARTSGSFPIPAGVTQIGKYAFENCTNLTGLTFTTTVLGTIGEEAFKGCTNLEGPVTIPASVTTIEANAFGRCTKLTTINVHADNYIYSSDTTGVVYNKDKTILVAYPAGKTGSYTIPSTVSTIGKFAFYGGVITSVTIHKDVDSIEDAAFSECAGLGTVTFNTGIKIDRLNFKQDAFPGDLFSKFYTNSSGNAGTYTRSGNTWTWRANP